MHPTGSFCYTVIEKATAYLDKPTVDAKYPADFILRNFVGSAMSDVFAHLNLNYENPVVIRHQIDLVAGQRYYHLPPAIQEVWWFGVLDSAGNLIAEALPRGTHNPMGRGWAIEGNLLTLDPTLTESGTAYLFYVPSGEYLLHYGTGTLAEDDDNELTVFTLQTTPTFGLLDRRLNAYAGQMLRLLPAAPLPIEERVIATHTYDDSVSPVWGVTVRVPFVHAPAGAIAYEIAPPGSEAWYEAVGASVAKKLGVPCKITDKHMRDIDMQFRRAIKTIGDNLCNLQMRTGKAFDPDTVDNPMFRWC